MAEAVAQGQRAFVISKNLRRRHLDASQRAMVAARLATLSQGRPSTKTGKFASLSQPQAADSLNVSERSVRNAKEVLDDGVEELVEAVDRGEIAVSKAAEIAKLDDDEQRTAIVNRTSFTGNNQWFTPS
jgi:hypothetical protein